MTHPVRHAARRRVPVGGAGADTKNLSERGASMETPHANQTAWNGNNRTFAWDHLKLAHSLLDPTRLGVPDHDRRAGHGSRCEGPLAPAAGWRRTRPLR